MKLGRGLDLENIFPTKDVIFDYCDCDIDPDRDYYDLTSMGLISNYYLVINDYYYSDLMGHDSWPMSNNSRGREILTITDFLEIDRHG